MSDHVQDNIWIVSLFLITFRHFHLCLFISSWSDGIETNSSALITWGRSGKVTSCHPRWARWPRLHNPLAVFGALSRGHLGTIQSSSNFRCFWGAASMLRFTDRAPLATSGIGVLNLLQCNWYLDHFVRKYRNVLHHRTRQTHHKVNCVIASLN